MKPIILTFASIVSLFTVGCEIKHTTEELYNISFNDSTVLSNLIRDTGADNINGYLSTYIDSDSVEHVIANVTIQNPKNLEDISRKSKFVADSIIKSIDGLDVFDSLIVNYTHKTSVFSFFTQNKTTYTYNKSYVKLARSKLFQDLVKWIKIMDSLLDGKEWKKHQAAIDSLSLMRGYRNLVINAKVNASIAKNKDHLSVPKEIALKEIAIRPLNRQLNLYLGNIYMIEKQYDLAAKYYDNLLRQVPMEEDANYYRGYIYVYSKDYKSAMKHFLRVKESGSNMADKVIDDLHKGGY